IHCRNRQSTRGVLRVVRTLSLSPVDRLRPRSSLPLDLTARGDEFAVLAALADGSLAPECRAALEDRVTASSELGKLLAEQERAVALAQTAAVEIGAPAAL